MSIKNLTKKQVAYLKDKGTITVKKTLSDRISIPVGESTRFKDAKGDLSFGMNICRDGVQEYLASEIFDSDLLKENDILPDSIIRVWRPPTVVFNPAAIKSHNGLPMTRNHPDVWVDSGNRIMLEKGLARDCWYNKDNATVSGTGFVTDASMVSEIESGKFTDISDGYDSELDFEPGVVPQTMTDDAGNAYQCTNGGEDYDMIMRSYKPNHIAIVPEGRAGNAKILDHNKRGGSMNFFEKFMKKHFQDELKKMPDKEKAAMLAEDEEDPDKKEVLESIGSGSAKTEGKNAVIVGGYNNIDVPEFNTDGAAVSEAEARKAVLTPDGSINRVIHGIKDSKGNPVRVVRQFDAVVKIDNEEVKDMQIDEDTKQMLKDIVNEAMEERLGGGEPDADDVPVAGHGEPGEDEPEYVSDKEAAEIGIAEEYPEETGDADPAQARGTPEQGMPAITKSPAESAASQIEELLKNPALSEKDKEYLKNSLAEMKKPAVDAMPETEGLTAEQLIKYATGVTDPETKRMAMALSEKIASDAAKAEDANPETEKARLAAAAGSPSNQVTDEEPDEEKDGYFVPKKLADSDGERAKILLDSISTVKAYGLNGIDPDAHAKDGTIYNRIIDAAGLPKVTKKNRITRSMIDTAINVIAKNRNLVDGMASLTRHINDTKQTAGGYNPGEEY